jgi:PAS domain S-box-containing protein
MGARGDDSEIRDAVLALADSASLTLDSQGLIVSPAPATLRMFGYDAGELVGRSVRTLMPAFRVEGGCVKIA